ncbi:MAG: Holliday junction branch migration protein RuvA [Clostridiales bacterium]|nr:Holliday junction branch migration protein RuvA [Clostridiales bacterium]
MIYSVTGTVVDYSPSYVAVDCNGLAFMCNVSESTAGKCAVIGEKVTLLTYLSVREDAMDLYGFYDKAELDCFKLLITISGVGPKVALAVLSVLTPDNVALSIASGDYKSFTKASGVGAKVAQRIVNELKDKMGDIHVANVTEVAEVMNNSSSAEAVAALTMLGYNQSEASLAVSKIDPSLDTEDIIKQALKSLARQ